MSTNYQRTIQEDFDDDDDGADAMEYEPSEKSLDQKSILDDIPEPYHFENTKETMDGSQPAHPGTSHFGAPSHLPSGGQYYNNDMSQNMSSFLNLSDSVSQKENTSRGVPDKSIESGANNDVNFKNDPDSVQELKQQIVEIKRTLSYKDQDLMYTKQKNEKLTNELNSLKASGIPSGEINQQFEQLIQENQFLNEKNEEAENEINKMKEYINEVLRDPDQSELMDLLQKERDDNEKTLNEKNQLLDFIEVSIAEQEKAA